MNLIRKACSKLRKMLKKLISKLQYLEIFLYFLMVIMEAISLQHDMSSGCSWRNSCSSSFGVGRGINLPPLTD
jgi:uncharacterized membrane protein